MFRVLAVLATVLSLVLNGVQAQQPARPPIQTTKVDGTDNVYIFRNGNHQSMFVVTDEGVIAKALVDNPDEVDVSEISGEQTIVLELRVAKDDLGKVIGKQGRTVKAMRAILNAASSKLRKRADLEILE